MKHSILTLALAFGLLAAPPAFAANSARDMYNRAQGEEHAVRSASSPSQAAVRRVVAAYERIVLKYPASGYSDNALWQAANLSLLAYQRFGDEADRDKAHKLFAALRSQYPSSKFAKSARAADAAAVGDADSTPASPADAESTDADRTAAPAIGAVLMSGMLALRPPPGRAGRLFLWAVGLFGLSMIAFALSRWFWVSLAILAASGAADMLSVYFRSTLTQVLVPSNMLGRVSAVNQIFIGSSNEIGAFESGLAAKLLGTVSSVVVGGVITVVVTALTAWRVPALRRLDRLEDQSVV